MSEVIVLRGFHPDPHSTYASSPSPSDLLRAASSASKRLPPGNLSPCRREHALFAELSSCRVIERICDENGYPGLHGILIAQSYFSYPMW